MKLNQIPLVNSSRDFDVSELFFSTTDRKGLISGCNDVFVRVSGYESEDLLGKPHNIVRHPHMPQCVFKLLWDYLLAGKEIGAYVKNLAQSGEYYWVFALAGPIDTGFLSVRLKPTSPLLEVVERLYKRLLKCEESHAPDWRTGILESTKLLQGELKSLGFDSYDSFMNEALRVEMLSRRESLKTKALELGGAAGAGESSESLGAMIALREKLQEQELFLTDLVFNLKCVALNSGVRASHLGVDGQALAVIAEETSRVSGRIETEVKTLNREHKIVSSALERSAFLISLASLQSEMADSFRRDSMRLNLSLSEQRLRYGMSMEALGDLLSICAAKSVEKARDGIQSLGKSLDNFDIIVMNLTKVLLTIQFAYVTGKTEAARVIGGGEFAHLLDNLNLMSLQAREQLDSLSESVSEVKQTIGNWSSSAAV